MPSNRGPAIGLGYSFCYGRFNCVSFQFVGPGTIATYRYVVTCDVLSVKFKPILLIHVFTYSTHPYMRARVHTHTSSNIYRISYN